MEDSKRTLDDEIQDLIEQLNELAPNTKEYTQVVQNLEILYKLKIEKEKCDAENDAAFYKIDIEKAKNDIEETEAKNQKTFRIIGYVLEGAGIVLPLIFYGKWMAKGFKFEETGTYCSKTFMGLQKFFKPTKK